MDIDFGQIVLIALGGALTWVGSLLADVRGSRIRTKDKLEGAYAEWLTRYSSVLRRLRELMQALQSPRPLVDDLEVARESFEDLRSDLFQLSLCLHTALLLERKSCLRRLLEQSSGHVESLVTSADLLLLYAHGLGRFEALRIANDAHLQEQSDEVERLLGALHDAMREKGPDAQETVTVHRMRWENLKGRVAEHSQEAQEKLGQARQRLDGMLPEITAVVDALAAESKALRSLVTSTYSGVSLQRGDVSNPSSGSGNF